MIPFEDLSEKNPRVVGITREALLKWKKVKGAKGYKVYLSTVGPQKGFKLKKTIKKTKHQKKDMLARVYTIRAQVKLLFAASPILLANTYSFNKIL